MKNQGFTLIELLAVIVILALVLSISIPTIITAIESIKKDSFASAARMMVASAKTRISEDKDIKLPPNNYDATIIKLSYLKLENLSRDVDNDFYSKANSYVLIVKLDNKLVYYVTLQGSKRKLNLAKEGTIVADNVLTSTNVTLPKNVGASYTSTELGESGSFTVTVKYVF